MDAIDSQKLTSAMARECLGREKRSAMIGATGVLLTLIAHAGQVPPVRMAVWTALLLAFILIRVLFAQRFLAMPEDPENPLFHINLQTVLIGLNGAAWGSMVAFFDNGTMDHLFYVRLLILSSGMAFSTGTFTVFVRTFAAFSLSILLAGNIALLYGRPDGQTLKLALIGTVYCAVLIMLSKGASRRFKAALTAQIEREKANAELLRANEELTGAMARINTLEGMLPICASCKMIRDEKGVWHQVEVYIGTRSKASFTHGLCPECLQAEFPDIYEKMKRANKL